MLKKSEWDQFIFSYILTFIVFIPFSKNVSITETLEGIVGYNISVQLKDEKSTGIMRGSTYVRMYIWTHRE